MPELAEISIDRIYELLKEKRLPSLSNALLSISEEIGQRQLSDALRLQRGSLQRILSGEAQKMDVMTLLKVSQFLNVDVRELLENFVSQADEPALKDLELAKMAGFITRNFDIPRLKKLGFLDDTKDYNSIAQRITSFFGYSSIYEFASMDSLPFFSRTRARASDKMHNFWLRIVLYQIERLQNPNSYSREALLSEVPKLRASTLNVAHGFRRFREVLYRCGVTVFVEAHVPKTQIRGGTLIVGNKPYIVLTDLGKRYDTLWHTLGHELAHVLFHFEDIKSNGAHFNGELDLFQDAGMEEEANSFADQLLISKEADQIISSIIRIPGLVEQYASQWNVHPSIVYGRFLMEHEDDYPFYRKQLIDSDRSIKKHKGDTMGKTITKRDNTTTESTDRIAEMAAIFAAAEKANVKQDDIFEGGKVRFAPFQNPQKAFDLYYGVIDKFKRQFIPKGKTGQPLRDEINKFLKEGKERGADGRQSFLLKMEEAINYCKEWLEAYNGDQLMQLYLKFRDLNEPPKVSAEAE